MNERIEQLFGQALDQAVPETWTTSNPAQLARLKDKFAELIVRECSDTVTDRCEMRNESDVKRAEYYAKRIKEHFGVEE